MKLLIASGIFHPDSGGPATYLYRLLPELLARGHDIRVLTYGDAPVSGYPYPVRRISFRGGAPLRWVRYALAYAAWARWADVIYVNTLGLPRPGDQHKPRLMKVVGDYAWERCVTRGWLPPDEDIDAFQMRRYADRRVEVFKARRAREVRDMARILVPSVYLQHMVIGWGAPAERVQVVYNALEQTGRLSPEPRTAIRARLGWEPDGSYLVTVARLTRWKGVDCLLEALAQTPPTRLVVIGDGPELAPLRAQAAALGLTDRVQFTGKIPHDQVGAYLQAADYLALYSGYEGLSHTILEALYAGTPVIASARGGNPETVQDGVNGLLVPHPDRGALIAALERAFQPGMQAQLAANARQGLDRFAWDRLVRETTAVLEGLAGSAESSSEVVEVVKRMG